MVNKKQLLAAGLLLFMPQIARADYRRSWNSNSGYHWGSNGEYQSSCNYSHPRNYGRPANQWQGYSSHSNNGYNFGWYGYDSHGEGAIRNGIRSGRLTPNELQELRKDQLEVVREQRNAAADGWISDRERREIQKDLNEYYKDLNHELNDGERRW